MENNRFKLVNFNDIELQDVKWLWFPYIPQGKITFIAGDPGIGKSFITAYLTSIVSNGDCFPYAESNSPKGVVIIQNGEDGAGDTIKKRLVTFQANFDNVFMIDLKEDKQDSDDLLLSDVNELDSLFQEIHPKLVIFDPITVFLGDIDMNSATKVRKALRPISKLAERYDCAIVFIIHRNKGMQGTNQIYRLLGSIDFGGIARSIISIGKGKDNELLFMHTKSNLAEKGKTLAFHLTKDKIEWLGTRDYMEDTEMLDNTSKVSPRENATNFIIDYLSINGRSKYSDILLEATKNNISSKTLNRARDDLKENDIIDKENVGRDVYWYIVNSSPNTHGE